MKKILLAVMLLSSTSGYFAHGQLKLPSLSPTTKITQDFSTSAIDITYSRPSMRNRKIFGDLVQYGNVWRTGANSATKVKFGEDVMLAGNKVKAGEYALYTIPGKEQWEVILNTGTGNWGADGYSKETDVVRFKINPQRMEGECQTFTMQITDMTYSTCKLELMWERTRIQIPVKAVNQDAIEKNIDKAINHPSIPYYQVASYYYENDMNLDKAVTYVDKALEADPKAFYIWYLKARLEKRLGHGEEAIKAARKSIETSSESAYAEEYKHNNQKIIDAVRDANRLPTNRR